MAELRRTTFVFLPAEEQIETETSLRITNLANSEILRPVMERIVELAEGSRKDIPPRKLEDKQIHHQCRGIALALTNGWRRVPKFHSSILEFERHYSN